MRRGKVWVLSHEKNSREEKCPYLAAKWWPIPIVQVMCRSASCHPPCKRSHAVFYTWRDLRLPWGAGGMHVEVW